MGEWRCDRAKIESYLTRLVAGRLLGVLVYDHCIVQAYTQHRISSQGIDNHARFGHCPHANGEFKNIDKGATNTASEMETAVLNKV